MANQISSGPRQHHVLDRGPNLKWVIWFSRRTRSLSLISSKRSLSSAVTVPIPSGLKNTRRWSARWRSDDLMAALLPDWLQDPCSSDGSKRSHVPEQANGEGWGTFGGLNPGVDLSEQTLLHCQVHFLSCDHLNPAAFTRGRGPAGPAGNFGILSPNVK